MTYITKPSRVDCV